MMKIGSVLWAVNLRSKIYQQRIQSGLLKNSLAFQVCINIRKFSEEPSGRVLDF